MEEMELMELKTEVLEMRAEIAELKSLLKNQSTPCFTELEDNMRTLSAEQIALSNRVTNNMKRSADLLKSLNKAYEESDQRFQDLNEKTNKIFKGVHQEMIDLKALNLEKMEKSYQAMMDTQAKNENRYTYLTTELLKLVKAVQQIPNPHWKDRVKQYALQVLITIGIVVGIVGAYQVTTLLMTFLNR